MMTNYMKRKFEKIEQEIADRLRNKRTDRAIQQHDATLPSPWGDFQDAHEMASGSIYDNSFPSPDDTPGYKQYKVIISCYGNRFECLVTLAVNSRQAAPTSQDLFVHAERSYIQNIRDHLNKGTKLSPQVRPLYPQFESAVTTPAPRGIAEIMADYDISRPGEFVPRGTKVNIERGWQVKKTFNVDDDTNKVPTETEKPEGTRDVEKFLKEQQDKLWRQE